MDVTMSDGEVELKLMEAGKKLLENPPSDVEHLLSLLDQIENCLVNVEQCPPKSTQDALVPSIKALVSSQLFGHSNADVKVAVASCISEITRITAPDAPYDDDKMRDVFQLIVSSFENLDDQSNRSYGKRAMILETVARVRSCVMMLDLECDALLVKMFQHFLKAIRDDHPENIFTFMETIMSLVLEESEDIPMELLYPLLDVVKRSNEGVLPVAWKLGKKVLESSAAKVKPYLLHAVRTSGSSVDEYSDFVTSICQKISCTAEENNVHGTDENEVRLEQTKLTKTSSVEVALADEETAEKATSPKHADSEKDQSSHSLVSNGISEAKEDSDSADLDRTKNQEHTNSGIVASTDPNAGVEKEGDANDEKVVNLDAEKAGDLEAKRAGDSYLEKYDNGDADEVGDAEKRAVQAGADDRNDAEMKAVNPGADDGNDAEKDVQAGADDRNDAGMKAVNPGADDGNDAEKDVHAGADEGNDAEKMAVHAGADDGNDAEKMAVHAGADDGNDAEKMAVHAGADDGNDAAKQAVRAGADDGNDAEKKAVRAGADERTDAEMKVVHAGAGDGSDAEKKDVCTGADDANDAEKKAIINTHAEKVSDAEKKAINAASDAEKEALNADADKTGDAEKEVVNANASKANDAENKGQSSKKISIKVIPPVKCTDPSVISHGGEQKETEREPIGKGQSKDAPISAHEDPSIEPAVSSGNKKETGSRPSSQKVSDGEPATVTSPSKSESLSGGSLLKKKGSSRKKGGLLGASGDVRTKKSEGSSESKATPSKKSDKKAADNSKEDKTPVIIEVKPLKSKKMDMDSQGNASSKQKKIKDLIKEDDKDNVSSTKASKIKAEDHLDTPKTDAKRRRTPEQEKAKEYGREVVGKRVKVWWPKDHMFYEGVIEQYDTGKKRHLVIYDDGDQEILNLKREKFEFIRGDAADPDEEQAADDPKPDSSSELPLTKRVKSSSNQPSTQGKTDASSKKKGASSSKSKSGPAASGKLSKSASKADSKSPKTGSKSVDDSKSKTASKSASKTIKLKEGSSTPKSTKSKLDTPKAGKSKEVASKVSSGAKAKTPKSDGKSDATGPSKTKLASVKTREIEDDEMSTDSDEALRNMKRKVAAISSKGEASEAKSAKRKRRE